MTIAATPQRTAHPPPVRRRWAAPPRLDVGIAVVFVVLTIAEAALNGSIGSPVLHVLVAGAAMAAVAWRRVFPIPVALVAVLANLVINPNHEFSTLLCLVLLSYTIGVETLPPRNWVGLAVILLPFVGGMALRGLVPSDVAAALVFLVGPWSVGTAVRQRSASPPRPSPARTGWSATASSPTSVPRSRSAPGSPASCTTSSPTRSAW